MKKKLNNYQKTVLNEIREIKFRIIGLVCFLFGLNYVKQLMIFLSPKIHFWFTISWGIALIIFSILAFATADKFIKKLMEIQ